MYADDTEFHCSSSQLEKVKEGFQSDLVKISECMAVNGFQLNTGKSVCMLINWYTTKSWWKELMFIT